MAKVHIRNVAVHKNPAPFFTPFKFEINFKCRQDVQEKLRFKMSYVSTEERDDQTLNVIVVDALPKGQFKFMFKCNPPNTSQIPSDEVGIALVFIEAFYGDQKFVRVGYYLSNKYEDKQMRRNPPAVSQFDKLVRYIASDEPLIRMFDINWHSTLDSFSRMHINDYPILTYSQ